MCEERSFIKLTEDKICPPFCSRNTRKSLERIKEEDNNSTATGRCTGIWKPRLHCRNLKWPLLKQTGTSLQSWIRLVFWCYRVLTTIIWDFFSNSIINSWWRDTACLKSFISGVHPGWSRRTSYIVIMCSQNFEKNLLLEAAMVRGIHITIHIPKSRRAFVHLSHVQTIWLLLILYRRHSWIGK